MQPTEPPPRDTVATARKMLAGTQMAVRVGKLKKLNRKERRAKRRELSAAKTARAFAENTGKVNFSCGCIEG